MDTLECLQCMKCVGSPGLGFRTRAPRESQVGLGTRGAFGKAERVLELVLRYADLGRKGSRSPLELDWGSEEGQRDEGAGVLLHPGVYKELSMG